MMKTDALIIGGSAAGLSVALAGKSNYPDKEFLVIGMQEKVMVPCGIPYIFNSLNSSEQNILPSENMYKNLGINYLIDEVTFINRKDKKCSTLSGKEIYYDKLVIATGSAPLIPKWLKGNDLQNVYTIPKDKSYLDDMKFEFIAMKKIVVIGGGFIGVEISDELSKWGKEVTLIEIEPYILSKAFDPELDKIAEDILQDQGVLVNTGVGVKEIIGKNGAVSKVILNDGSAIEAEAVVLSMGYEPNSNLAREAGLSMNEQGFIHTDEYLRTSDSDIIAVGDCAEKRDFVTRKQTNIMLASTACAEGRIAGMNLFGLSAVKTFSGTIAIFSTAINGSSFGCAGLNETQALSEGFDIETASFEGIDRHPGKLPGSSRQIVKLIVARESGVIIGGEVFGGKSIGELINLIGFIIQSRSTVFMLQTVQIGTHPMLTASPASYPLINAANLVASKLKKAKH